MTTLLIVDDNSEMRQLIRRIMSKICDEIFECEDGDEVLAAFAAYQPDWVLMDVEMKRVDGLKATAELTRAYPEAKVIIVTKYDDDETRQAASNAGAWHFVGKDDLLSFRMLIKEHPA
jgi:CheY-like chemotaxis protein